MMTLLAGAAGRPRPPRGAARSAGRLPARARRQLAGEQLACPGGVRGTGPGGPAGGLGGGADGAAVRRLRPTPAAAEAGGVVVCAPANHVSIRDALHRNGATFVAKRG